MTTGKLLATAGILLALVSLSFSPAAAQSYTVTDLGTLLGGTISSGLAINDIGQVAGYSQSSDGNRAFFWSKGQGMLDLGLLNSGDQSSSASGLNNSGTVVGSSGSSAFIWTNSTGMADLGNLGGVGTTAYSVNTSGQVVGVSSRGDGTADAFFWTQTTGMQDLGTLGGGESVAYGVNDSGQVVGESLLPGNATFHAFLWTAASGMQDLGTLPGGIASVATGINASGQVVGWAFTSSSLRSQVAFLWDPVHGMRSLGTSLSGGVLAALGINASTQVVGYSYDKFGHNAGFLWTRKGGLQNLNAYIPKGKVINQAYAINKVGQIVGSNTNNHALLLTPTK